MIVAIVNVDGDYIPLKQDDEKMKTFDTFQDAQDYCDEHILAKAYDTTFVNMESGECEMHR